MAQTSEMDFMLACDLDDSHIPRCAAQSPGVGIWLIANVLMQRKHEGEANDLSLRCLSTDLAVAMVARMRAHTHTHAHTHSHIHTQNTKSPEAEMRDKPEPKIEIKL